MKKRVQIIQRLVGCLLGVAVCIVCNAELKAEQLSCSDIGLSTPSGPTAVSTILGGFLRLSVFARGQNQRIYESQLTHSGFTVWKEIPGGAPTASELGAVFHEGRFKLFRRGTNNRVYETQSDGTTWWPQWREVAGSGLTLSAPAAVDDGGKLKLFIRGLDNTIWENHVNNGVWGTWQRVGGLKLSAPAAVVHAGKLKLFGRGLGNGIHENHYNPLNNTWSGWSPAIGGFSLFTIAAPVAIVNVGVLKVFATGQDDRVFKNEFKTSWSGWSPVSQGALTPSGPAVASIGDTIPPFIFLRNEIERVNFCAFVER